jgi:hypothetical protein
VLLAGPTEGDTGTRARAIVSGMWDVKHTVHKKGQDCEMRSTDTRLAGWGTDRGRARFERLTICGAEMVAPKPIGLAIGSSAALPCFTQTRRR